MVLTVRCLDIHPDLKVRGFPIIANWVSASPAPAFGDLLSWGLTVAPQTETASIGRQNIFCRIDIAVVISPTLRTLPFANVQRQLLNNVTAVSTAQRTRKPAVYFY